MKSVSLANLDHFSNGAPWSLFEELRRESPVHWNEEEAPNSGFYSITRYHDIVKVLRDSDTFTSERFTNLEEVDAEQEEARRSLLETDGTRHRALRRLLQGQFTPQAVSKYETFLRGLTATTLDNAFAKGEFDFVEEVAAALPLEIICDMMGIPESDHKQIFHWTNVILGVGDPEFGSSLDDLMKVAIEMFSYAQDLGEDRVKNPREDVTSAMMNAVVDGERLTAQEFGSFFILLVVAGNETTRHTITHTMRNLMANPDQLAYLQENPDMIPWAVEEFLRYASPVYHFRRTVTKEVEFEGHTFKVGDKVVPWFASGNRDDTIFDNPTKMDVTRNPNEHMTFGRGGPHMCLGNALARIELRVMFEDLLSRIDTVEHTGPVDFLRSNFVHGIKHMPVKVTLR
jgi:cytochrome P450